jgi:hypothetical protein
MDNDERKEKKNIGKTNSFLPWSHAFVFCGIIPLLIPLIIQFRQVPFRQTDARDPCDLHIAWDEKAALAFTHACSIYTAALRTANHQVKITSAF